MQLRSICFGLALLWATLLLHPDGKAQSLQRYEFQSPQMGTLFKLTFYAPNDSIAEEAQKRAFSRVETLNSILSDYDPNSNLSRLSAKSGTDQFFRIDTTLFHVLSKAQEVARSTDGAFDVTIGPVVSLWRTIRKADEPELPSPEKLNQYKRRMGYQHLKIDSSSTSVALLQPDMKLDLGGIAKGFAADEILRVLKEMDIHSVLVDAGGDIRLGDPPPSKESWTISIPVHQQNGDRKWLTLALSNAAIATSGDLFQHVVIDGKRYSHIIDPRTGLGLTDQSMVTVIASTGITADSYASAMSVLDSDEAICFTKHISGMELLIEYKTNKDIQIRETPGFSGFTVE